MALCKTEGLILRSRRQGETSKILTIYTKDFGKISLIAKGSRSIKSRNWGALEPFTHIALVFYQKENRELQFLSQADILEFFVSLHAELGKMILASTICELVDRTEMAEAVNPALYALVLKAMRTLEKARSNARNVIRAFQLKLIGMLGYEPKLSACKQCGNTETKRQVTFALDAGYFKCQDCIGGSSNGVLVSSSAIEVMNYLQKADLTAAPKIKVSARLGQEIDEFLSSYLRYHIEGLGILKSTDFLQQIGNSLK